MRKVTNPAGERLQDAIATWAARISASLGTVAGTRFEAMMLDTWTTTMTPLGNRVFVITGDIPAMWLRDSSAQMLPFLHLVDVPEVAIALRGVVREQWRCIAVDPYANAFNAGDTGAHFDPSDLDLHPGVWERKYEIDSLAFPVLLAHRLWEVGDRSHLGADVHEGCRRIVEVWRTEQRHAESSGYRHIRESEPGDTLPQEGRGGDVAITGMTWSGFRPSDDANHFGYNIPAQLMAVRALRAIGGFARLWNDEALAVAASDLASQIKRGVEDFGVVENRYAYEVDGLGGTLLMDDANMPSLLSLPLISDVPADDERYLRTREWVLGSSNPYYAEGAHASGVGSPHTPHGYVWHIALAVQGLTGSRTEARRCLDTILATDGGTGWTHESFDPDDPSRYTRAWFSWSNSMTCELMMQLAAADGSLRSR